MGGTCQGFEQESGMAGAPLTGIDPSPFFEKVIQLVDTYKGHLNAERKCDMGICIFSLSTPNSDSSGDRLSRRS